MTPFVACYLLLHSTDLLFELECAAGSWTHDRSYIRHLSVHLSLRMHGNYWLIMQIARTTIIYWFRASAFLKHAYVIQVNTDVQREIWCPRLFQIPISWLIQILNHSTDKLRMRWCQLRPCTVDWGCIHTST